MKCKPKSLGRKTRPIPTRGNQKEKRSVWGNGDDGGNLRPIKLSRLRFPADINPTLPIYRSDAAIPSLQIYMDPAICSKWGLLVLFSYFLVYSVSLGFAYHTCKYQGIRKCRCIAVISIH